jgi:excisionase family DNA binding protein
MDVPGSQQSSPFFTIIELYEANEKKIGINTLRGWARAGRIKTVKVGRKYLVPKSELLRLPELAESQERQ